MQNIHKKIEIKHKKQNKTKNPKIQNITILENNLIT